MDKNVITINGKNIDEQTYEYILKLGYKLGCEECKQGKWKKNKKELYYTSYYCSICRRKIFVQNNETLDDYPYCHCGANMRGSKK